MDNSTRSGGASTTGGACAHCGKPPRIASRLSIHGMYDMHLFHPIEGATVDELIENWERHNSDDYDRGAYVGGSTPAHFVKDMGKSWLCPVVVLDQDGKELRRVGGKGDGFTGADGIFPVSKYGPTPEEYAVKRRAFRDALLADPDIPRLLAESQVPA
jgi:hypothetical protein